MQRFLDEMLDPYRRLTDFAGRTPRSRFWPFILLLFLIGWGLMAGSVTISMIAMGHSADASANGVPLFVGFFVAYALWLLLTLPAYAGAIVRRLHDIGRSGWWALPQGVLLAIGLGIGVMLFSRPPAVALGDGFPTILLVGIANNFAYLGWTLLLVIFAAQEGTRGANRYGPDPIARP